VAIVKLLLIFSFFLLITTNIFARTSVNDLYQAKRIDFENSLSKITDQEKQQAVRQADQLLKETNLKVCDRFDVDVAKMAAILEEEKSRQGINKTVVAYGQGETPLDNAAYYVNFAAEAVAYQKIQDYTPQLNGNNPKTAVNLSTANLKSNLNTVQGKIIRAKQELKKALDYYEK
jgi:hypothetical protein